IATLLVGRVEQLHYLGVGRWQTARPQVTLNQSVGRGKFGHRTRLGGGAGFLVVFHELVSVGGEHERNVVELADPVALSLLQAVFGRESFALGFENGERNRLTAGREWTPQNVIRAAFRAALAFAVNDVNRRGGFLDLDVRAGLPSATCQRRVNQLESCLGFIESTGLLRWVAIAHALLRRRPTPANKSPPVIRSRQFRLVMLHTEGN